MKPSASKSKTSWTIALAVMCALTPALANGHEPGREVGPAHTSEALGGQRNRPAARNTLRAALRARMLRVRGVTRRVGARQLHGAAIDVSHVEPRIHTEAEIAQVRADLETLTAAPRTVGSEAYDRAGEHIVTRVGVHKDLEIYKHEFEARGPWGGGGGKTFNIIVIKRGRGNTGRAVVDIAHLDSVRGAPGANDNGSGVVTQLREIDLSMGYEFEDDRVWIFEGAEELGLLGTEAIARDGVLAQHGIRQARYNSSDMTGGGTFLSLWGGNNAAEVARNTFYQTKLAIMKRMGVEVKEGLPIDNGEHIYTRSSHYTFVRRGAEGVLTSGDPQDPNYHSPRDTMDKVSLEQIATGADVNFETAKALDGKPTPQVRAVDQLRLTLGFATTNALARGRALMGRPSEVHSRYAPRPGEREAGSLVSGSSRVTRIQ